MANVLNHVLMKDQKIINLIKRLRVNANGWVIVDHWDSDSFAFGVAHPRNVHRLVYISTAGMPPGRYYYACEVASQREGCAYEEIEIGHRVEISRLQRAVAKHLAQHDIDEQLRALAKRDGPNEVGCARVTAHQIDGRRLRRCGRRCKSQRGLRSRCG